MSEDRIRGKEKKTLEFLKGVTTRSTHSGNPSKGGWNRRGILGGKQ